MFPSIHLNQVAQEALATSLNNIIPSILWVLGLTAVAVASVMGIYVAIDPKLGRLVRYWKLSRGNNFLSAEMWNQLSDEVAGEIQGRIDRIADAKVVAEEECVWAEMLINAFDLGYDIGYEGERFDRRIRMVTIQNDAMSYNWSAIDVDLSEHADAIKRGMLEGKSRREMERKIEEFKAKAKSIFVGTVRVSVGAVKAVGTFWVNIVVGVATGITWTIAKAWGFGVSIVKGLFAGATWFYNEMTVLGLRKKNMALLERIEALEASQAQQDVDISRTELVVSHQIDDLAEVASTVKGIGFDTGFLIEEVVDLGERLTVNEQVARAGHAEHSGVISTVTRLSDNLGKLNDVVEGREARDLEKVLASTHRAATQEKVDVCVAMASPKYSCPGVMVEMVMTMIIAELATREMVEAKLNSKQYLHCDLTEVAVDVLECKLEKRKYMSKEYLAGLIYESCKAVVEQPRWANL
jgi:hypothetical protein